MAEEGFTARMTGRMTEAALRLRQPARRISGTVRSAVTIVAVIVGAYTLLVGSILCGGWGYRQVYALVMTSGGFSFITAILDIALIFGVLIKDDKILQYILCATMAVYLVCIPLSMCTFLGTAICGYFDIPLWEIARMGVSVLHLGLMYCLLAELRGDPLPPLAATPPPPAAESVPMGGGWLKNNLARTGPPAPGHAGDEALLKVRVDHHLNVANGGGAPAAPRPAPAAATGGGGPAVFAPSSCTTAAPVHPSQPPPAVPAAVPDAVPPSTSEA